MRVETMSSLAEIRNIHRSHSMRAAWARVTPTERRRRGHAVSARLKAQWASMTPEQRARAVEDARAGLAKARSRKKEMGI